MTPLSWLASLRGKLTIVCGLILLLSAGMLLLGNLHILQRTLAQQANYQTAQVTALLDQSIATPLAQRDYAVLQQILERVIDLDSITYIVLFDHRGRRVAGAGWNPDTPLPPLDTGNIDLWTADAMRHLASNIMMENQLLGSVQFGVSTAGLRAAQATFQQQTMVIAVITLMLSIALVSALAAALTRNLARLERSSRQIAAGNFEVTVPLMSNDEVGRLGASFNAMALALQERMNALSLSERLQREHLQDALSGQAKLSALVDAIPAGIVFVDTIGRILHANGAFVRMWQLQADPADSSIMEVLPSLRALIISQDLPALAYLLRPPVIAEPLSDIELRTHDGRLISQRVRAVIQNDCCSGYMCFHEDITHARSTEQQAKLAMLDPLTKLLNRRGLLEALVSETKRADAGNTRLLLMFIDLDDFKHANDVGGHRTGDDILVTIGTTLLSQFCNGETVARLGGDEFAIICPDMTADEGADIAARVIEAVSRLRFTADREVLRVGCSIGLAYYPSDAKTPEELIACSDTAMYKAKQHGKNGWMTYEADPTRLRSNGSRIDWNSRIHRALLDKRFVLHYQPVFHAGGRKIAYHEALLRMVDEDNPERLISPIDFISHAERSGKICQIDRWVFGTCVELLAAHPHLTIAANLSVRTLDDSGFTSFLREIMQRTEIDPRRLHIELTETSAISDPATALAMVNSLRALGCAVHLDDFGSGFSSFAHLKLLDVETIKIDGVFIRDLDSDPTNQLFVAAIIAIARQLNKTSVAEHVESQSTLDLLIKMGVDYVQGYYLARPTREPWVSPVTPIPLHRIS